MSVHRSWRDHLAVVLLLMLGTVALLVPGSFAVCQAGEVEHLQIDDEILLGSRMNPRIIEKCGGAWNSPATLQMIVAVVNRLVPYADRSQVEKLRRNYSVTLVNDRSINASCTFGGNITVTRGFIEAFGGQTDVIACVLGHEITHSARRHLCNSVERRVSFKNRHGSQTLIALYQLYLSRGFEPAQEMEADVYGMIYAKKAGFNPEGMARFCEFALDHWGRQKPGVTSRLKNWLQDNHPRTQSRLANAREVAKRLNAGQSVPTTPVPIYDGPGVLDPNQL